MCTSYLVNIVANDFKDGQSIFQPFLLDQQQSSAVVGDTVTDTGLVNGLVQGVKDAVTGVTATVIPNGH